MFPISRDKSYLHFQYNKRLLNNDSLLVKYENKAVQFASKVWTNLQKSDKSVNKKIVHYVGRFLDNIPWTEDSLRSIPSKSALLRQVRQTGEKSVDVTELQLKSAYEIKDEPLVGIPVLYPSSMISSKTLGREMDELCHQSVKYHKRQMLLTGLGIPLSLPFALVPVVPNIPGFYLAYRFYCNFKANLGGDHLSDFIEKDELIYKEEPLLDELYQCGNDEDQLLVLNEVLIEQLVDKFEVPEATVGLRKALKQERKRLAATE